MEPGLYMAIEEYHKPLEQNISFGSSLTKDPDTQSNHFFASSWPTSNWKPLKLKLSIGHLRIKAQLHMAGLKAMH